MYCKHKLTIFLSVISALDIVNWSWIEVRSSLNTKYTNIHQQTCTYNGSQWTKISCLAELFIYLIYFSSSTHNFVSLEVNEKYKNATNWTKHTCNDKTDVIVAVILWGFHSNTAVIKRWNWETVCLPWQNPVDDVARLHPLSVYIFRTIATVQSDVDRRIHRPLQPANIHTFNNNNNNNHLQYKNVMLCKCNYINYIKTIKANYPALKIPVGTIVCTNLSTNLKCNKEHTRLMYKNNKTASTTDIIKWCSTVTVRQTESKLRCVCPCA